MKKVDIAVGERWFVKLPGATALTRVCITEFTMLCVQCWPIGGYVGNWYDRRDIKFVERVAPETQGKP